MFQFRGIKKIAADIAAFIQKHRGVITGAGIYHITSWIYDNPLWMSVELKWKEMGVLWMVVGAFVINTILLIYFRNKKTDFILWSALDEFSKKESDFHEAYTKWGQKKTFWRLCLFVVTYVPAKLVILILWCLKKSPRLGDLAAFLILPIIEDPFIATMYLRHGHKNGLKTKDYAVYLVSSIISIGYWTARNVAVVELVIRPMILRLF
jgi:hypothetical protein